MSPGQTPVRPAPGLGGRPLRTPATWILAGALLVGLGQTIMTLQRPMLVYPRGTLLALVLFALYAVPFLAFITRLDYLEREPVPLLAVAFAWGALVANATAIPANGALDSIIGKLVSPAFDARWGPALVGPTIEEPAKLLGIIMIALTAMWQINSLVDGFVYGAVVGLGFQVIENVVSAVNQITADGRGDQVGPVITTFFKRGFVSGLWSHTVFTALAGAGVAYFVLHPDRPLRNRLAVATLALAGAWLCHFVWNSPILTDGLVPLELLVKGIPPLVLVLALTKNAGYHEARFYADRLQQLRDCRIATPAELMALGSASNRAASRRAAEDRGGQRAVRAAVRLQRAQAHLAVALSRSGDTITPAVGRAYAEVLAARHRLIATGRRRRRAWWPFR